MASNTNAQRTTSLNKDNTDTDAWGPQNIAEFNRWFISAITTSDLLKQLADKPQWVAHIRYIITSGEPQKKTPQKKAAAIPAKDDDVWKAIPMKSIMKPFYADPALFVDRVVTNWVNSLDLKSWKITDGKGNLVIVDDDRIKNVSRHAHNLVRGIRHKLRSQICDAAWNYPWGSPTERIQRANFGDYFKTEEGKDQLLIWIATTVLESTPNEAGKAKVSGNLLTFVQENLIRFSSMASHDTAKKALAETKDKEFKNAVSATIEDVQMISDSVSVASHATDQVDEPSAAPFEEPSSIAEEQPPPKTNKKTTKASKKRKRGDSPKKHNTRSSPTKRGRPAKK